VTVGGMQPGVYTFYVYTGFTDHDLTETAGCINTRGTVVTDTTGIIGPAGEPRVLCLSTETLVVLSPSAGLSITKTVKDDSTGGNYQSLPNVVNAGSGDSVSFRVRVANVTTTTLTDAVVYDLLPRVGDTGVIASQAGASRGTTVNAVLTGITVPSGWAASYSTDPNPCRPEVGVSTGCATGTFTTTVPALPSITAIMLTKASVTSASIADLVLTYAVPPAATWVMGDVVFNSAGATATQGTLRLPPAEPPKVGFQYPASILIWHKVDGGTGDPLGGATFRVTNPAGWVAMVLDDGPLDMSSVPGTIQVQVDVGTYLVTETAAPPGYVLSSARPTATFRTPGSIVDLGSIVDQPLMSVFIQKLGQATTGEMVAMDGSTWQVLADKGGAPSGPVPGASIQQAMTSDGHSVTGLWQVSNLMAGTYWLTETNAPAGFSLLPGPVGFTVDATGRVVLGAGAGTGPDALVTAAAATGDQSPWWVLAVHDVPAVMLPAAGGPGSRPWLAGGALLTVGAALAAVSGLLSPTHRPLRRRPSVLRD
ncbi:MAG: SpaA isopeptide-forming pilin-related protein, partial [Micrococcales bacterium]|nr:SpaA isopeptide-forming pilin-related protein [Micrococcales bacterium]